MKAIPCSTFHLFYSFLSHKLSFFHIETVITPSTTPNSKRRQTSNSIPSHILAPVVSSFRRYHDEVSRSVVLMMKKNYEQMNMSFLVEFAHRKSIQTSVHFSFIFRSCVNAFIHRLIDLSTYHMIWFLSKESYAKSAKSAKSVKSPVKSPVKSAKSPKQALK